MPAVARPLAMSAAVASDAQHWHRAVSAVQRLLEYAPASGSLALWVQHRDVADDDATAPPRAAVTTDGTHLFYASSFAQLPLPVQTGWVAHAVLHIALRHVPRLQALRATCGDVDAQLFNLCADAIVNTALSHLAWLELPPGAVHLEKLLREVLGIDATPEAALAAWDVERLYRAVDDRSAPLVRSGSAATRRTPPAGQGERDAERGGAQPGEQARETERRGGDAPLVAHGSALRIDGPRAARLRWLGANAARDLLPGADADRAPEAEAELARDWLERLLRAHAGDAALSLLRSMPADLPRSRTPWEQVLRRHLARGLARRVGLSWSRPARSYLANQGRTRAGRRMPWEPGTTSARSVPRLALVIDVSGSIDAALLARFSAEVAAITRRQASETVLVIGDNTVQRVAHCTPGEVDLRRLELTGGGGTDFTPLLEEADRHRPDVIVVLTDLEGPARYTPRASVLWAVPETGRTIAAPFGRLLLLR
jgi:predicted metal-dependent peptidase